MSRCGIGQVRHGTSLATTEGAGGLLPKAPALRLVFLPPQHRGRRRNAAALARCSSSISCSSPPAGFLSSSWYHLSRPHRSKLRATGAERERDDERKALFFFVIRVWFFSPEVISQQRKG